MICDGWYINDVFIPFADSRQGQPNGVATLDETGQNVAQEEEAPNTNSHVLNWSENVTTKSDIYVTHLLLPIDD